ncbi:MAG TPA: cyclic nucleotide-binding domain-containing protein [Mycobacteriales bacterium]|nr:cyclic nucleotide-binding domain-containing protein [Mycobacteriales bacterium]
MAKMTSSMILTNEMAGSGIDWAHVLADIPLFAELSPRHVRSIAKLARIQRIAPYTQIVTLDDQADSFYILIEGTVVVRPPGKRLVKLGPGEYFGELALLDDSPRTATVEAGDEVVVARIKRTDFNRMLKNEPAIALNLLRTLAKRLRASEASPVH